MTLLITVFAAVISTAVWYRHAPESKMKTGILCWLYWGASLMWFVDACFEYGKLGAEYFNPQPDELLNDAFLGLSVVALGMVIWIVVLLVTDPKGVVRAALFETKSKNTVKSTPEAGTQESKPADVKPPEGNPTEGVLTEENPADES